MYSTADVPNVASTSGSMGHFVTQVTPARNAQKFGQRF